MFRFKQFTVRQDRCPMKVGTDGVLLGAWATVLPSDRHILDIGTGTGLIALMMAQRVLEALIIGVDIDDVSQARENADTSPWGDRVEFVQSPVQDFVGLQKPVLKEHASLKRSPRVDVPYLPKPTQFDLIVSNPPYFVDSLTSPDQGRTIARHTGLLSFEDLRDSVVRLLKAEGRFAVILPTEEAERFISICRGSLTLTRRTDVRTTPRHAAKRVLMEFRPADDFRYRMDSAPVAGTTGGIVRPTLPVMSELVIGTGEHEQFTHEYRILTRDFYLKF